MATYAELIQAAGDSALIDKVRVACVIAADAIRQNGAATAAQKAWARGVFNNPETPQTGLLWAVLAQNKASTLAAILGATDTQVQTAVDAAVALFSE
jgi:hypothetical protein